MKVYDVVMTSRGGSRLGPDAATSNPLSCRSNNCLTARHVSRDARRRFAARFGALTASIGSSRTRFGAFRRFWSHAQSQQDNSEYLIRYPMGEVYKARDTRLDRTVASARGLSVEGVLISVLVGTSGLNEVSISAVWSGFSLPILPHELTIQSREIKESERAGPSPPQTAPANESGQRQGSSVSCTRGLQTPESETRLHASSLSPQRF